MLANEPGKFLGSLLLLFSDKLASLVSGMQHEKQDIIILHPLSSIPPPPQDSRNIKMNLEYTGLEPCKKYCKFHQFSSN